MFQPVQERIAPDEVPPRKLAALVLTLLLVSSLLLSHLDTGSASAQNLKARNDSHACSVIEQGLLTEINLARTKPAQYASYLEQLKPLYSGNQFKQLGRKVVTTVEGWKAVEDAIAFLRAAKPVPALAASVGMCCGAGELTKDQKKSGRTGHQGSDGSYCEQRAARFGAWTAPIGENLTYGNLSARERVLGLLIDDGVSNRGHRKRLLDTTYKVAGIACDEHSSEEMLCVITLAGGFREKVAATATKPAPSNKGAKLPAGAKRF